MPASTTTCAHRGIRPGRPFAEHARDALALLTELPATPEHSTALVHARFIAEFHERSVAGQGSFVRDEKPSATRIIDWHRQTGAKIAYWDGIAHTAAASGSAGGYLREHCGSEYASVAIGFHHGDLGVAIAPDPAADLIDSTLAEVDLPAYFLDLHGPAPDSVARWLHAPAHLRVISGIYKPAEDHSARMTVNSLAGAFDALVHIRESVPVHWLPQP